MYASANSCYYQPYPSSSLLYSSSYQEPYNSIPKASENTLVLPVNDEIPIQSPENASVPAYFTTQKIVNSTAKLSYTVYQLQVLNVIYNKMKYPNSEQKTLIAQFIGITREQVKVNFL
jgi:hypothetical protein